MAFKFNFETLLSIKEKMEDKKKNEYGIEIVKLENEKNKLKTMEERRVDLLEEMKSILTKSIKPMELSGINMYIGKIDNDIINQKKVVERQEGKVVEKQQELIEAMTEKKSYEKLKSNAYEEYVKENKIKEQKQIDELVSYKHSIK
ncbi:MAG: flagellar export protein FliJ [Lachnospirales bacterium]